MKNSPIVFFGLWSFLEYLASQLESESASNRPAIDSLSNAWIRRPHAMIISCGELDDLKSEVHSWQSGWGSATIYRLFGSLLGSDKIDILLQQIRAILAHAVNHDLVFDVSAGSFNWSATPLLPDAIKAMERCWYQVIGRALAANLAAQMKKSKAIPKWIEAEA